MTGLPLAQLQHTSRQRCAERWETIYTRGGHFALVQNVRGGGHFARGDTLHSHNDMVPQDILTVGYFVVAANILGYYAAPNNEANIS